MTAQQVIEAIAIMERAGVGTFVSLSINGYGKLSFSFGSRASASAMTAAYDLSRLFDNDANAAQQIYDHCFLTGAVFCEIEPAKYPAFQGSWLAEGRSAAKCTPTRTEH